jgi:predicted RNase H-like HicB family nuclease
MSDGRTPTEAIENATKAIDEWINEAVRQQPRPASTEPIETRGRGFSAFFPQTALGN